MIKKVKELYAYRELLFNLVKKELKLRYKNSVLGFFWSLLNPLLMMLIFTFVFAHVFRLGIKDFPIFLLTGLLPWNFFNMAVSSATGSVVAYGGLVKKVYFPREIIPISIVFADLINFLIAMVMLFAFLIVYGYNFYFYVPILLVVILIQTVLTIGLSLFLASINVYFRDIQYIVGVAMLALFYATPIIYNIQMVENMDIAKRFPILLMLYKANPLSSLMILYRNVLYETHLPSMKLLVYSALASVGILLVGYLVFHRLEPAFAEEV
jgi:ABC-2 type transport system permease protein